VAFGRGKQQGKAWEHPAHLKAGVMLGMAAALCQALGTFFAKPAIAGGWSRLPLRPSAWVWLALCITCCCLLACRWPGAEGYFPAHPGPDRSERVVALGLGMTLIMLALQHANVATVGMLSALSPVLILPMLWLVQKQPPPLVAWLGAFVSCAGTALIVLR
jgi:drug/metabolite transporter (DMT)-like permease